LKARLTQKGGREVSKGAAMLRERQSISLTSLESTGKESSEWRDQTSKGCHDEGMKLKGSILEVFNRPCLTGQDF
jgi:hypothetical protein